MDRRSSSRVDVKWVLTIEIFPFRDWDFGHLGRTWDVRSAFFEFIHQLTQKSIAVVYMHLHSPGCLAGRGLMEMVDLSDPHFESHPNANLRSRDSCNGGQAWNWWRPEELTRHRCWLIAQRQWLPSGSTATKCTMNSGSGLGFLVGKEVWDANLGFPVAR